MCVGTWLHEEQGKINPVQNYAIGGSNCWYFGELLLLLHPSGACKRDETHHFFLKAFTTISLVPSSLEGSTQSSSCCSLWEGKEQVTCTMFAGDSWRWSAGSTPMLSRKLQCLPGCQCSVCHRGFLRNARGSCQP